MQNTPTDIPVEAAKPGRLAGVKALPPTLAVLFVLCVLITLLAYLPVLDAPWFYDDIPHVLGNSSVTGDSVVRVFTRTFWGQPAGPSSIWSYRPVASLVTRLITQTCEMPLCSRLVNLLIHFGICLGLFLVLRRWFSVEASALAACLFMIHPVHSEAILFAVGRAELLAAGFSLLAFHLYFTKRPTGMLLAFTLALFSKESASLVFPVLVAHALGTGRLSTMAQTLRFSRPFLLIGAVNFLLHRVVSGNWRDVVDALQNPLVHAPSAERWLHVLSFPARYLSRILWPFSIPADYGLGSYPVFPWSHPALLAAVALSLALPLACVLLVWRAPSWRGIAAGILVFYALSLVAFQWHALGTFMLVDRHLYLPMLGLFVSVAACAQFLRQRVLTALSGVGARWAASLLILGAVALLTTALFSTVPSYANATRLARAWLANTPGGARAHFMLGNEYANQDRPDLALEQFETALGIYPDYHNAGLARAKALSLLGREAEAGKVFAELYARFPQHLDTAMSYGIWLWRNADLAEAERVFTGAANEWPDHYDVVFQLGRLTESLHGPAAALPIVQRACRLNPKPSCSQMLSEILGRLPQDPKGASPPP